MCAGNLIQIFERIALRDEVKYRLEKPTKHPDTMAKGGLKGQLQNHKLIETIDKSRSKPVAEKNKPVKVSEPVAELLKPVKPTKKDDDGYKSEALSKKEQRKLKKLQEMIEKAEEEDSEEEEDEEDEELDLEKLAASDSDSELEEDSEDEGEEVEDEGEDEEEDDEEEEEEDDEDIPLSDVEVDEDADVVPHTKLTINNMAALRDALARVALPWAKHSFQEHQSVVSEAPTEAEIKDIYDDTERELAFYKQGLHAVKQARATLVKLKVPFLRPMDYFAEMAKSDEHMDKLKQKLLTEAANKKALEDAKKQRMLKKFGKQVQNATLQERAKQKKESLEKIKLLKKRGASEMSGADDFEIALEEATREEKRGGSGGNDLKRRKPNSKRLAKDAKYGLGGPKRGRRENDAKSSADVSGFLQKKMKGKQARPGKNKRKH